MPYSGSPATGWPIACRCARIWCVRPVSRRTRSSVVAAARARSRSACTASRGVVGVRRHPRAHAAVAADRRVDRAAARGRAALDEREVLARRSRGAASAAFRRRWASVERATTSSPRRVAVEAVDDARPALLPAAGHAGQRLRERAGGVPARRVHDDAGRLVDDEQVLVLVGAPRTRPARRAAGAGRLAGLVDRRPSRPRRARWRLGTHRAVDEHARRRRSAAARARASRAARRGTRPAARPRRQRRRCSSIGARARSDRARPRRT